MDDIRTKRQVEIGTRKKDPKSKEVDEQEEIKKLFGTKLD